MIRFSWDPPQIVHALPRDGVNVDSYVPKVENPGYRRGSPSEKRKKGPEFPEKLGPRYSRFGQLSMSDLSSVVFTPVVAARCYLEVEPTERSVEPASPEKRLVLIVQRGQ